MKTIKKLLNALSDFVAGQGVTIIAILICACFFVSYSLVREIDHTAEVFELQTENLELNHQLNDSFNFIQQQSEVTQRIDEELEEAGSILRMQSTIIEKMIERLKELKSWPLKIKPFDPDTAI